MAENNPPKKSSNRSGLLIGILVLLLIAAGVGYFLERSNRMEQELVAANLTEERDKAYGELERMENELEAKIEEIEALGFENEELQLAKEELMKAKAQVEAEKRALARKVNATTQELDDLRQKVSGYEQLLRAKDAQISNLQAVNQELMSENTTLKEEAVVLEDSLTEVAAVNQELNQKVEVASQLRAENMQVFAVSSRGRERADEFRARQIDKLKIAFTLGQNDIAPIEGKDVMVRILDPNGKELFDVAAGSGSFLYQGKEIFFTAKQNILFDNTGQALEFMYQQGTDYLKGTYSVEVYIEDYLGGKTTFNVK